MTYQEVLDYLYQQLPMFQRIGNAAFKKSLDNIITLCDALGNPQHNYKTVHVAGTNGKGSSSHMLAAVLQEAGYKTGLYTSPHLKSFTERVRVNGAELSQQYLIDFVANYKSLFEEVQPSFFEMTVALAFKYFADENVDVAVIEVGLGGRLDSTNIITPEASLITNIGFDHQNLLGNTLQEIAGEKAGIIKPCVPATISLKQPDIENVFREKAAAVNAPLYFATDNYSVVLKSHTLEQQVFDVYKQGELYLPELKLDLTGIYQRYNLSGVLQTIALLTERGFTITEEAIRNGLANTKQLTGLKGRWQVLNYSPLTICDTGHNADGINQILTQLHSLQPKQVHFVFGAVNDKDVTTILVMLPKNYSYYFCQATIPRALPVAELQQKADLVGLKGKSYPTVAEAIKAAKENAATDEVIFIGGSTFVVAEIEEL
ncbi:bifunctional folylpolyglutamate synthase/dihydrofolate synthase [Pontibacter sp. BT310]|uniref:Dihydrofolate synthase/folylpolyglutamate synthase n=2 Tax=Pontibacter populi TaxID=890055 RepID=A0ABS6X9T9_9BACT|nr:folylpolyglutamate synthase/dihydrofolate synthase family protein [Pontibacter sp. BT310]MBJ6117917.1 bifunctional folylpolyglutamate synthase/dihydrofolate synthase [Pontibacter sp. BT310]MBR0570344.1 bifunctional folylpolyglutamate synthase/dihydrofolate synthase [Microvirga sp. STS03]MBW3364770.1 bifunctional folylpolyglutamate synthase/dihydrofolate synthase [Pontibacter populi]